MKTNNTFVKIQVQNHIINSVYDENENEFKTLKEACNHLNNEFIRVAGHENNLKRFPNHVERFTDYLRCVVFHFEYEDYKINEFLNNLGINPKNKTYSSDQIWNLYGLLIYREMIKNL